MPVKASPRPTGRHDHTTGPRRYAPPATSRGLTCTDRGARRERTAGEKLTRLAYGLFGASIFGAIAVAYAAIICLICIVLPAWLLVLVLGA